MIKDNTRVSTKYQVVIPKAIRRNVAIKPKDKLYIYLEGEKIILRKTTLSIKELRGSGTFSNDYLKNERLSW